MRTNSEDDIKITGDCRTVHTTNAREEERIDYIDVWRVQTSFAFGHVFRPV